MKKIIVLLGVISGFAICIAAGIYIGAYKPFPYYLLKNIKDGGEAAGIIPAMDRYDYTTIDPETQISINPQNRDSIRTQTTEVIFGTNRLPANLPVSVQETSDYEYIDMGNLAKLEQFEVMQDHGINSVGYIFHPVQSNNRLMIYQEGHAGDFRNGKNTIAFFLKKGFTVYSFSLPNAGKSNHPIVTDQKKRRLQLDGNHDLLQYLENPLSYFIEPVIVMLNYAEKKNFAQTSMCGLSGGGWVTTLSAAIDSRIDNSYSVAGVYPMYIMFNSQDYNGDFESTYPPLVQKIHYLDLFVLGSEGRGRKHMQIYNEFDPCCFNGRKGLHFKQAVANHTQQFKHGVFDVFIDSLNREHSIGALTLERMYAEIMNSPLKDSGLEITSAGGMLPKDQ